MLTLIASLGGFISSMVPELFRFLQDRYDKKHELAILDKQVELAKLKLDVQREEIDAKTDIAYTRALYTTYNTGVKWVDALNGTVRPVLAYSFFLLYAAVKYAQFLSVSHNAPLGVYLDFMWTENDWAIFAGIVSFYFGNRSMQKMRGK